MATSKVSTGYKHTQVSTSNAAFAAIPPSNAVASRNDVPVMAPLLPAGLEGLSIMNGMTAGYGDNDGHISNPPAQAGTYGGNPKYAPKRIGVIRTASGAPGTKYSLYFIFNPNEIDVSFSASTASIPPNYATAATTSYVAMGQQVSWSLIFDRTYDLLYGDNKDGSGDKSRGVLEDVAALYNLMATYTGGATGSGIPRSTQVQVAFAQESSGQLWGFTGWIIGVDITYGIFRHDMIPSRAEVDITMLTSYVPHQVPPASPTAVAAANVKNLATAVVNDVKGGLTKLLSGSAAQGPPKPKTTTTKSSPSTDGGH